MGKKGNSSKRKASESEMATEVLSHKSPGDKDGIDVIDGLSEPTMGEKLANLKLEERDKAPNNDNIDSAPNAKPPSADSVSILLKQALRADDRALLLECLYRQDEKLRGAVLACALPWFKSLLLQHSASIISQEQALTVVNSLFQLIESRVSSFNHALQLSSSLDLLYAEMMDDGMDENDVGEPAIYEDNDESDDEEPTDSMEMETVEDGEEPQPSSDISDDAENVGISH